MRGKAHGLPSLLGDVGITPAYAGKSANLDFLPLLRWDHPRVCGEKLAVLV